MILFSAKEEDFFHRSECLFTCTQIHEIESKWYVMEISEDTADNALEMNLNKKHREAREKVLYWAQARLSFLPFISISISHNFFSSLAKIAFAMDIEMLMGILESLLKRIFSFFWRNSLFRIKVFLNFTIEIFHPLKISQ